MEIIPNEAESSRPESDTDIQIEPMPRYTSDSVGGNNSIHLLPTSQQAHLAAVPPNCCSLHLIPMRDKYKSIKKKAPLEIVKGSKQYVYDSDGVQYLDCVNGTSHVGHCHPQVLSAANRQMSRLVTSQGFTSDLLSRYVSAIVDTLPEPLNVSFLTNSGSEANDLALRLAAAFSGSDDVLVLEDGYHGNIGSLVDVSPKIFKKSNLKKKDHVHVARLPDMFRGKYRYSEQELGEKYAREVEEKILQAKSRGKKIGAFLCETMFVIPGVFIPPRSFFERVFRLVREQGGVVILDEVQSGLGRAGNNMWFFMDYGLVPDIVTMGKGLGNGYPLGAVVCSKDVSDRMKHGYFSTFGGNPVACAIGLSVLEVIKNEKLMSSANMVGKHFLKSLNDIKEKFECVGDVRGSGLVLSVELVNNKQDRYPASELASQVMIEMKNKQILTAVTGRDQNVLLITPPMCFNIENCRTFTNALEQILSTINQSSMNISSDFLQLEVEDERPTKRLKMEDNDLVSLNNEELSSLFDMD